MARVSSIFKFRDWRNTFFFRLSSTLQKIKLRRKRNQSNRPPKSRAREGDLIIKAKKIDIVDRQYNKETTR